MRRALLQAAILIVALSFTSPARAASLVLDEFTDAMPPSACLSNTQAPVVFWGPYCDGATCPPDAWVTDCDPFWAEQPGLPGVFPGTTRFLAISGDQSTRAVARVKPELQLIDLHFIEAPAQGGYAEIAYRQPGWDLPLGASGATAMRFTLGGTITPQNPVVILFGLADNDRNLWTHAELEVTAPGVVVIPLHDAGNGDFDLNGVDDIYLNVFNQGFNTDGPYPERHLTVGPLTFDLAMPTATRRPSWGAIKSMHH